MQPKEEKNLRIVFMGTPAFAVPSLEAVLSAGYTMAAVITAPDRPAGRGHQLRASPVKEAALRHGIPLLQPERLKDPGFLADLQALQADVQVVVAFRMLPRVVWQMPRIGTFNLHASLLPQYRGAAPINWAIINGETETGLTTFFLEQKIDTGDLLLQEKHPIYSDDNAGTLHDRLSEAGAKLVVRTLDAIAQGTYQAIPQPLVAEDYKPAPKIFTETCQIDWNQPTIDIHNFVRGLAPYPAARMAIPSPNCKVFLTEVLPLSVHPSGDALLPGTPVSDNKTFLYIRTRDGFLAIHTLQPAGKKRMSIAEFLRGNAAARSFGSL
ncbi:MAG: methionyl-tRNA formyltransferase [Bernardetiaceae bacterium]